MPIALGIMFNNAFRHCIRSCSKSCIVIPKNKTLSTFHQIVVKVLCHFDKLCLLNKSIKRNKNLMYFSTHFTREWLKKRGHIESVSGPVIMPIHEYYLSRNDNFRLFAITWWNRNFLNAYWFPVELAAF